MAMRWFNKRKLAGNENPSPQPPSVPRTPSIPKTAFPSGIKLLHDVEGSLVDIVFVHGLIGDREKTWTAKSGDAPWPQVLLPARIPNGRFLTFGYDAYVTDWRGMVSKNRIGNHSWNLLTTLATYREDDCTNDRPIIFVCHSLGGLVCEDALSTARQRPEKHLQKVLHHTRGIIFLGTPHHGSGLALWAERLAKVIGLLKQTNPEILSVLQADSEVLARIQDSFHTMIRSRNQDGLLPIEITCFFEEIPLPGVGLVVPSHSAVLPGYIPIPIRSNHLDMTKFDSAEDPGFTAITGELRRWVKELGVPSNVEMTRATTLQQQQVAQVAQVAQMAQSLSLSEPSGIQVNQPTPRTQNHQTLQNQESQSQSIANVRHASPQFSPPAQTSINGQENQAGTPQPSVSLGSTPFTQSMPTASPTPGVAPGGINIAGAGGDIKIGNSEQHLSGNFYGGVHVLQGSNQSHPFAAYLPQANMGPNERALLKAAGKGDLDEIRKLLRDGANLDAINEEGQSALTMAISRQHLNVVKLLIENGATMDRSGFLVHKPLHVAVGTRNVDLVKCILDGGADVNETTTVGSALLLAVKARHENIVTLLLSRNADANINSPGIKSPMYQAIYLRQERFVPILLKYGAEAHNLHQTCTTWIRKLSPACRNLLQEWGSQEAYSEHVKTLRSESSDQIERETALFSALCSAIEHGHKDVHSIFMDLATEFAIPVGEGYKYTAEPSK
ncbi:hypothetical protein B7463_g6063, partial [Scytalidium lignicola]